MTTNVIRFQILAIASAIDRQLLDENYDRQMIAEEALLSLEDLAQTMED